MARTYDLGEARGGRGLLPLAVVSGLVAAVLVFIALVRAGDDGSPGGGTSGLMARVVVAEHDIPARTEISPAMLREIEVPASLAVRGAQPDAEGFLGETTRYPIAAGQQITSAAVGPQAQDDGLAFVVPKGLRAFAVEVDEIRGVAGLLLPGDRVDVIVVLTADEVGVDTAVTVLQDIEVLAVAQKTQDPLPAGEGVEGEQPGTNSSGSGQRPEDAEPQPDARTVTLAVAPGQAQRLALLQENGKVWLSLRRFGEGAPVEIPESILGP